MSLNNLRNRLKKLETEKVSAVHSSELSADHTETCDITVDKTTWVLKIQKNGNKPGDWLEMIKCLENTQFENSNIRYLCISNIYADALKSIPDTEKKTLPYAQLLIQCANFRGQRSVDDARELFQDARYDAKRFAIVHIAAAQFELDQGNKDKAKKILDKAKSQQAEPASLISEAFRNLIYDNTQLLNSCAADIGLSPDFTSESNKENIDDSNSHTLPPKLSGLKPPLPPNHSYRKRHNITGELNLKPTLSHHSHVTPIEEESVVSFVNTRNNKQTVRFLLPYINQFGMGKNHHRLVYIRLQKPRSECRSSDYHRYSSDDADTHNNTGTKEHGCTDTQPLASRMTTRENTSTSHGNSDELQPPPEHQNRGLRSYHSTPDCKKSSAISMPSGSSVKGVFARKKMNLGKPMRVPRSSPLTEELVMAKNSSADHHQEPPPVSEPMAIPPAVKSQHQLQTESRAASTVLSRIMRENIGDSGRRQSESDDDSIRLKPLPDFSPEREQQPYNNHNVFDVRNGRGSIDSDSGIMSHPGTGNVSRELLPPLSESKHVYGMSPPHITDAAGMSFFSSSVNKPEAPIVMSTSLEPKPSQTRSFLDASQLNTKTLVENNSLLDGASKTLTNSHGASNKESNNGNQPLDSGFNNHLHHIPENVIQGTSGDSGISSSNSSTSGSSSTSQNCIGNGAVINNNTNVNNSQVHVDGNHGQMPQYVHSQQQLEGHLQVPNQHPGAVALNQGMQTPHHKQRAPAPMYTPMQGGMVYAPAQAMATPVHGGGMYPAYPNPGVAQMPGSYPPHQFPQQMMTPLQNQQKMLIIKGKCYTVIRIIGKGGFSKVYEVLDSEYIMRAVKCVNMDSADELTIESYKNEIELLQRLQHSRLIIKMYDYEFNENDNMLYVVMEKGERDLATFFRSRIKRGDMSLKLLFFYWEEMLKAVLVLHKEGIVHSDLKPPNFLIVAGDLKLIDFGIAKAIQADMTSVTIQQQVGTLNYMSPEAFMDTCGGTQLDEQGRVKPRIKIGVKSDVWSLGCILYYLVYRKTPFQHITNAWMKLQAITNADLPIEYPEPEHFGPTEHTQLVNIMKRCLTRDPKNRPSIEELLNTPLWSQN